MRWEGWAGAILVDGCGGLGSGQYGGQNARTSKHSAVRRMGWCNPGGVLWRLRVRLICVAKFQRFPSILDSFARLGCRLGRLGRVAERLGGHAGEGGGQRRGASPLFPPACDLWRRWRVILRSWRLLWRFWRVVWCSWRTSWRPPEASWRVLGASWSVLSASWRVLAVAWSVLGASWGVLGATLGGPTARGLAVVPPQLAFFGGGNRLPRP